MYKIMMGFALVSITLLIRAEDLRMRDIEDVRNHINAIFTNGLFFGERNNIITSKIQPETLEKVDQLFKALDTNIKNNAPAFLPYLSQLERITSDILHVLDTAYTQAIQPSFKATVKRNIGTTKPTVKEIDYDKLDVAKLKTTLKPLQIKVLPVLKLFETQFNKIKTKNQKEKDAQEALYRIMVTLQSALEKIKKNEDNLSLEYSFVHE